MTPRTFTRQRIRIERRFEAGARRDAAMAHLARDARAVLVLVDMRLAAWRLPSGAVVCVKRRYPNEATAQADMAHIRATSTHAALPVRVYFCNHCGGMHTTSQKKFTGM